MALGPGKYDDLCGYVRRKADATGVVLIVLGGNRGTGFSVQADLATLTTLPDMLEHVASEIRKSFEGGKL